MKIYKNLNFFEYFFLVKTNKSNLIATGPVYGFGKSEEIAGKALKQRGEREIVVRLQKLCSNGK
jgi:hypothetical protein